MGVLGHTVELKPSSQPWLMEEDEWAQGLIFKSIASLLDKDDVISHAHVLVDMVSRLSMSLLNW